MKSRVATKMRENTFLFIAIKCSSLLRNSLPLFWAVFFLKSWEFFWLRIRPYIIDHEKGALRGTGKR